MANKDWKIHIPARRKEHVEDGKMVAIRISTEAYNNLIDCYNETSLSMKDLASILINEAAKHVAYDKEEE